MLFSSKLSRICFLGHGVVVYSNSLEYESLAYYHQNQNPEGVMLCVRFHSKTIPTPQVHWPKGDSFLSEQYWSILSYTLHAGSSERQKRRKLPTFSFFSRTQRSPWRATVCTSRCVFEETTTFIKIPVTNSLSYIFEEGFVDWRRLSIASFQYINHII